MTEQFDHPKVTHPNRPSPATISLADTVAQFDNQARTLLSLFAHHAQTMSDAHWSATMEKVKAVQELAPSLSGVGAPQAFESYMNDWFRRSILFLDILRRRGNAYIQHEQDGFKPVLLFDYDLILDGRTLSRPVNYALVRIRTPEGYPAAREDGRPYVIIDPRAGHGSGIGGFKAESEVGVALRDGHPVYFVIFNPTPEPDQTLADICQAEAAFLKEVRGRHPRSPAPLIYGNCQGGWASMILAATHPDLTGPIVIAGAPLSYWAGKMGGNPFRYYGGIAGGSVPALLASDLGAGKFDGAGLVLNFEQLNPAATWWRKYYDLFADVEGKSEGFLKFEDWWSGFYFMNEKEIRWIVENLFIGNKLARGGAILDDGTRIDLSKISAPVIIFASHGDNITPPQQALNWIADLHESVEEIRARGHVIIYTLHNSVGHLGIFVSAKIASKQHKEITSVVKTIEALPPGLYEMLIEDGAEGHQVSFETRTIADVLAHDDGREEEAEFEAVAKLSEWATKTYEVTMRPALKSVVTPALAEILVQLHPMRQQRYFFSDKNPMLAGLDAFAAKTRENTSPALEKTAFHELERIQASVIEQSLNAARDMRDAWIELTFHTLYASPWMKAISAQETPPPIPHDVQAFEEVRAAITHLDQGGYAEAIVRILILLAHARGSVRRERLERSNRLLHARPPFDTMPPQQRVRMIHEQNLIVEFAPNEAVATLFKLLRDDVDRIRAVELVYDIAGPQSEMDAATAAMFQRIQDTLLTLASDWRRLPPETATEIVATPNAEMRNEARSDTA